MRVLMKMMIGRVGTEPVIIAAMKGQSSEHRLEEDYFIQLAATCPTILEPSENHGRPRISDLYPKARMGRRVYYY